MEPTAAMAPLEVILKYPGPWLAWILPMIGALSMPLLSRFGPKVRDYGAVAWAFTSVISAASMVPWLFSGHYPGDIKLTTWITFPGGHPLEGEEALSIGEEGIGVRGVVLVETGLENPHHPEGLDPGDHHHRRDPSRRRDEPHLVPHGRAEGLGELPADEEPGE